MAFSDFSIDQMIRTLGVTTREADLFPAVAPLAIPAWLTDILGKRTQLALISEKARSEFIVVPILMASRELSPVPLAIFSGQRLDVDPTRGLVGECDFILATAPPVPPLRSPIITVVEAKKNDIEGGIGQCAAEMVAAQLFNRAEGRGPFPMHGCITTGEVWQFLRLTEAADIVEIDARRYYLDDVGAILAAIQAIIARAVEAA
ncbi:MAG: hypothetical protein JWN86_653 [Planctomycetota bacterium]|nr:hypothetical protein [Planctomycetota bacterium]